MLCHDAYAQDYKYGVMYYKNNNSIGLRRKFGNKGQCFSFGGAKCRLDEAALRGFAKDCQKKPHHGEKMKL